MLNNVQPAHDQVPSPTVSASRKRKTSQSIPSLSLGAPYCSYGAIICQKGQILPGASAAVKSLPYTSTGPSARGPVTNRCASGALAPTEPPEAAHSDPLIGRRIMTRWSEDNSFYEAVITDYNPIEGVHLLVYDINTPNETWEWVNLKEMNHFLPYIRCLDNIGSNGSDANPYDNFKE